MPNSNFMSEANATAIFTAYATAIKLGLKAWIGTTAEWNQLTDAQKKQYQVNFKTDDCSEESIEIVKKSIADDFSINVNYDKGEYCYHLGDLYKFTSAHTAGAWSSADVEQVQVCDELSELKNTLIPNYTTSSIIISQQGSGESQTTITQSGWYAYQLYGRQTITGLYVNNVLVVFAQLSGFNDTYANGVGGMLYLNSGDVVKITCGYSDLSGTLLRIS